MQVIPQTPGVAGSSPVLRLESCTWQGSSQHKQAAGLEGLVQHLVPWVPAIIQGVKPAEFIIVIAPPAGLLELGQRQQLAQQLGAAPGPLSNCQHSHSHCSLCLLYASSYSAVLSINGGWQQSDLSLWHAMKP